MHELEAQLADRDAQLAANECSGGMSEGSRDLLKMLTADDDSLIQA